MPTNTITRGPFFLLQMFTFAEKTLGPRLFASIFRPFVYSLFIAGEDKGSITAYMAKMANLGLLPFVSPMLEDDPDSTVLERSVNANFASLLNFMLYFFRAKALQNIEVIKTCIECFDEKGLATLGTKTLAIKYTAFISVSHLVKIA